MNCPHCGHPLPPAVCATCEEPIHAPSPQRTVATMAPPPAPVPLPERVVVPIGIPAYHLYQPPPDWRQVRPIAGLRSAVIAFTLLYVAAVVVTFLMARERMPSIQATLEPLIADPKLMETFDSQAFVAANRSLFTAALATMLVSSVLTVVGWLWTFRARSNAEALAPYDHRRHKLWIILGWIVPPVFLWFPKQIVDDIWQTSDPKSTSRDPMVRTRSKVIVNVWWLVVLSGYTLLGLVAGMASSPELTVPLQDGLVGLSVLGAIVWVVIVWRITALQERQRQEGPVE